MGAPKENQFWKLRSTHGRAKLFETPELMWEAATEYFNWVDGHPWYKVEQLKKPIFERDPMAVPDDDGEVKGKWIYVLKIPTVRPYTMQGLCLYLDCNTVYFNHFEKQIADKDDDLSKGFSQIITRIRETIFQQKFEGAAVGAFNGNLIARELGIRDNVGLSDGQGNPLQAPPPAMIILKPGDNNGLDIKESE